MEAKQQLEKFMWGKFLITFKNIEVAHILLESGEIKIDDEILIMGETTGVLEIKLEKMIVNDNDESIAKRGDEITLKIPSLVRRNDKVYLIKISVNHIYLINIYDSALLVLESKNSNYKMSEIEIILYLGGGLVLLFIGGEGLIRGSSNLAIKIGITPLLVGLTVVAFGTSAPELVVSLKAALMGNSSISLGNVVGSNIANIALILGIAALIRPLEVQANVMRREIPIMIGISVLMILFLLDGEIG